MYYTVYKITNNFDDKCYIGVHQTANTEDGYMGSGVYLNRAYEKHGIENFSKEILFSFTNPSEMFAKEAELVNEDFVSQANTYNLKVGGDGGWDFVNRSGANIYPLHSEVAKNNIRVASKVYHDKLSSNTEYREYISKLSANKLKSFRDNNENVWLGRSHSDSTKSKMSEKRKGRFTGKNNANSKGITDSSGVVFNSVRECATHHNVHEATIRRWCKSGKFRYNDRSRTVRYGGCFCAALS